MITDSAVTADKELQRFGYTPTLSRSLTLWQLTSFGLNYLQPIGSAVIFGFLLSTSKGTVALPCLFAFIGMLFTVASYSVLIKEYPLAGSIYNYVKIIVGSSWGFIAGWLLALDYILIPTITCVSAAMYAHQLVPNISYETWLIAFVFGMGLLNLIGIKAASYFSAAILIIQIVIVLLGFYMWASYLMSSSNNISSLISMAPFKFQSISGVIQASSLAIFGFLGFDAVTTLAEESINPQKDIPRAMFICVCIGFLFMFVTGYLGVLIVPDWESLLVDQGWLNATLFYLAKMTGGDLFALIYTVGFILAMVVTNLVGTTAATRLLYGMGRDKALPMPIFAAINKRWQTPHWNIIVIMLIELILGSLANQDQLAELINFGAISAFVILNMSVIFLWHKKKSDSNSHSIVRFCIFPLFALGVMLAILINMKTITLVFGAMWGLLGIFYYIINRFFNCK